MRSFPAVLAVGLFSALVAPAMAAAGAPVIERFSDASFDAFYCRGGPIEVSVERDLVAQCLPNRGAFVVHVNWTSTLTNPATGLSVEDPGAWMEVYEGIDYPGGQCPEDLFDFPLPETQSIRGSLYHLRIPGEGVAVVDAGVVTIDMWTGEILFLAGPHEGLFTGVDACELLGANECPPDSIEDCWGGCAPSAFLGDGQCDDALWCPETNFDEGDCCAWGEFEDCSGDCVAEEDLFDAWGNGTCDPGLECEVFWFDGGDCPCGDGFVEDCYGGCFPEDYLGDGWCDANLDCEAYDADLGDCEGSGACGSDEVVNCEGGCTPAGWIGDLWCDAELACEAFANDEGDCDSCEPGEVLDCSGGCTPGYQIGDGHCDPSLDCETWSNDAGDCL